MKTSAISLLILFAFAAQATMVKPMSVEELTVAASSVVEGQASDTWTSWNAQHTRIYSYTRVRISKTLKGPQSESLIVKQLGGSADGYTQHVSGVRPMQIGESALLFLRPSAAHDGTMVIVGLMQGQFRLARESSTGATVANNGVIGAEEIRSGKPTVRAYQGSKLTLQQIEMRVWKAVSRD